MQEYLFSYGTLQKEQVQVQLFGRVFKGYSDRLEGYRAVEIEITDESFLAKGEEKYQRTAIISENKDDSIKGTVFEVTRDELLLADKYEPDGYDRIKVQLQSGKEAWIYIMTEIT